MNMRKMFDWARRNGVPLTMVVALKGVLDRVVDVEVIEGIPYDGDLDDLLDYLVDNKVLSPKAADDFVAEMKASQAAAKPADRVAPLTKAPAAGLPGNEELEKVRAALRAQNLSSAQPPSPVVRPAQASPPAARPAADAPFPARPLVAPSTARLVGYATAKDRTTTGGVASSAAAAMKTATKEKGDDESILDKIQGVLDGVEWLPDILKNVWVVLGILIAVVLVAVIGISLMSGGPATAQGAAVSTQTAPKPTPTPTGPEVKLDENWWKQIKTAKVTERSPMRLGYLDQMGIVAHVLGLGLFFWMVADVMPRKKSQRGVVLVAVSAVLAGLFTVPVLNMAGKDAGWTFVASLFLLVLWAVPVIGIITHGDNTALAVALALFALVTFDVGRLNLPLGLSSIFGKTWPAWQGITGFGGWLQLVMALRFGEAALTTIMFAAVIGAIIAAAHEVGKKYRGALGALVAGLIMLVLWAVLNYVLGQAVLWLAKTQNLTRTMLVVLEVLRPIVAWLLSMGAATWIGTLLGDLKVEWGQNKLALGLGGSAGGWTATTADFAVLATIFALAGVLLFVL